ncbi:hypothetical protein D9M68_604960 [compost metagenome]
MRAHLQAVRVDAEIHAAGIPEARAVGDELVVGRIHEHLDVHGLAVLVQGIADHAAHVDAAEIHRRTDIQGPEVRRLQLEALAGAVMRDRGRNFQAVEVQLGGLVAVLALDRVHTDIGARQQRAQAGHATHVQARPDHPEIGAFARQVRHFLGQLGLHHDLAAVGIEADGPHRADGHVLVAELGLADFQPLGGVERNGNVGPGLHPGPHDQGQAHQGRHDGHQPDP